MYPSPGTPVYVWVGLIRHLGIVSDRHWAGAPMVISHSFRRGGTYEEPWDVFAGRRTVHLANVQALIPGWVVVARARSWIGRNTWSVLENCEHHVRHALGHEPTSPQLRGALAILGAVALTGLAGVPARGHGAA